MDKKSKIASRNDVRIIHSYSLFYFSGSYFTTMKPHLLIPALALFFLLLQTVTSSNDQPDSLKIVHIIFRHGQRTPADTYPLDPHVKNKFEPYGWGQLTNVSILQVFEVEIINRKIKRTLMYSSNIKFVWRFR